MVRHSNPETVGQESFLEISDCRDKDMKKASNANEYIKVQIDIYKTSKSGKWGSIGILY